MFPSWHRFSQYPQQEVVDGLFVNNSRYFLPPKVGGYFHPQLIDLALASKVDRIREKFEFDLIDAHWVYPSGAWAGKLGKRYDVPVVMTGRGEDMARFPQLPLVGNKIRWALKQANGCIGVSEEIAQLMIENGAPADRVCTIANGVDATKFYPKDQTECRNACGLPLDRPTLLSVGDRLELKGFHLIAEAVATIKKRFQDVLYVIVGGPGRHGRDFTDEIKAKISHFKLHDHVQLSGKQPHDKLVDWYNSADAYVMMSSREGSPNVLLEAMACGTPAIGTAVGGICDELADPRMGRLIQERTPAAAVEAIESEFANPKIRSEVAAAMKHRTWDATAKRVHEFFERVSRDRQLSKPNTNSILGNS